MARVLPFGEKARAAGDKPSGAGAGGTPPPPGATANETPPAVATATVPSGARLTADSPPARARPPLLTTDPRRQPVPVAHPYARTPPPLIRDTANNLLPSGVNARRWIEAAGPSMIRSKRVLTGSHS